jgi:hypothetical protein
MAVGMSLLLFQLARWCVLHWGEAADILNFTLWWWVLVWLVGSAWRNFVNSRINSDHELKAALNNEMHLTYKYRSQRNGLYTAFGGLVMYVLGYDLLKNLDGRILCFMLMCLTMEVVIVSWLVYNRR